MKSNRPLWSNMSWRTHKCLRTCQGNMHFCRLSRLKHWGSYCAKHRTKVLFNQATPMHKILKRHYSQKEWYCHFRLGPTTTHIHTQYTMTVRCGTCNTSCDPAGVSPCGPCVVPAFLWWTTGGKRNLLLQPFLPQLPGNIIKNGSLSGPHARCHPPTTFRLSSAATLQSCFHKWFILF